MKPDTFMAFLRHLDRDEIEFRVTDDGRHILRISGSVSLYVEPKTADVAAVAAGLRALASAATEMAAALEPAPVEETA